MRLVETRVARRVRQSRRLRPAAIATYQAIDRLLPAASGPRVLANSLPKAGTHLLTKLLDEVDGMRFNGQYIAFHDRDLADPDAKLAVIERELSRLRPSRYLGSHLIAAEPVVQRVVDSDVTMVTILRDPRAALVSMLHYMFTVKQMKEADDFVLQFPTREAMVHALIEGSGSPGDSQYFPDVGERYRQYVAWLDAPVGKVVRFEDLVGDRGGGSADDQLEHVTALLEYLGCGVEGNSARQIAERVFSPQSITFRSGGIDTWREDLSPADCARIEELCGDSMARLGYDG